MLFETCSEMPNVGMVVFLYGVANFLALVGETTYCLETIADMRGGDKSSEYLRTGIYASVRVLTMSMCAWWIISANQFRTRGMKVAFAWIIIRAVGNVTYAYGSIMYEFFLMPDNLLNFLAISSTFSHKTRAASAAVWLLGEAFVLSRMYAFYRLVTAPDHSQAIHEKGKEEPAEEKEAVSGDK
ncbi:uncharacterized protein LOC144140063 [Haemaphysalis longicornis]